MKKYTCVFIIVFISNTLFSIGIPQNNKISNLNNNNIYYPKSLNLDKKNNTNVDTTPKIIASIPKEKIYLYALQEQDGFYRGLVLSINGVNKFFDWKSITERAFLPQLYYVDLNNDDKKELTIILYEDEGTGIVRNVVYIINSTNFTEYKFKNPLDVIKENIETKILSKKEVDMKINNTIHHIKIVNVPKEFSAIYPNEISKIYYKDYIKYYMIDDNILRAEVGVEINPLMYLGHIIIDYSFKNGAFKANKISFEGNPTVVVTTSKTK